MNVNAGFQGVAGLALSSPCGTLLLRNATVVLGFADSRVIKGNQTFFAACKATPAHALPHVPPAGNADDAEYYFK